MNQLQVSLQHSIVTLAAKGWSARKIARELRVYRETLGRYLHPVAAEWTAVHLNAFQTAGQ